MIFSLSLLRAISSYKRVFQGNKKGETTSSIKECICRYMISSLKVMVQIRMKMLAMMILKISWLQGGKTTLEVVVVGAKKGSE